MSKKRNAITTLVSLAVSICMFTVVAYARDYQATSASGYYSDNGYNYYKIDLQYKCNR